MSEKKVNTFFGDFIIKEINGQAVIDGQINITKMGMMLKAFKTSGLIKGYTGADGIKYDTFKFQAWPDKEEYQTDWKTHSMRLNTFVPEPKAEPKSEPKAESNQDASADELPY